MISLFLIIISDTSNICSSQSMTGRQQILKEVTAHPVDSTPFNSKHQFPTNVPTEKVHPSCSSYLQSITSLLQTRSDHIKNVNDWASTVALDVFYFLGAIFLLLCIYNLKRSKFYVCFFTFIFPFLLILLLTFVLI